jgi:anti-sigma regulatory factor (Ser/Thr protein kinase)
MCQPPRIDFNHTSGLVHEALIYRGEHEIAHYLERFVADGIASGEPVLVAVSGYEQGRLSGALAPLADRMRFEDVRQLTRNPSLLIPLIDDWIKRHTGRVRVVVEANWAGRSAAEAVEVARNDALVNLAFSEAELTVICPHDADQLSAPEVMRAERTHPALVHGGGTRLSSPAFDDPLAVFIADDWPLEPPDGPIAETDFNSDLGAVRRFVHGAEPTEALPRERAEDLVFAINEAAGNVIRHGRSGGTVRIWSEPSAVIAEVVGPGPIADPLAGRRRPAADALGGRGLWLINQVCDLVELRTERALTTIRIHMRTPALA